jgi:NAD(P)H-flavin reductase
MATTAIMRYRITSITSPAPETRIFRMEPVEPGAGLMFLPGQFVFLHALGKDGASLAKKPYSIASSPDAPYLEFCIRMRHGDMTGRLEAMETGSVVGVEGPFGNFAYEMQKEAGFVAGGVGIAPFMSMLRYISGRGIRGRFVLFYSAKTRDDLLYGDELAALRLKNPDIKIVITLTRDTPAGWNGECGRLDYGIISKHAGNPEKMSWWICGPLGMAAAMKSCLVEAGKDAAGIKVEGWG